MKNEALFQATLAITKRRRLYLHAGNATVNNKRIEELAFDFIVVQQRLSSIQLRQKVLDNLISIGLYFLNE